MFKDLLCDTGLVQRSSGGDSNDFGESDPNWNEGTSYKCRLGRLKKGIAQKEWGIESDNVTIIYFKPSVDVKTKDRVTIDGTVYVVIAVRKSKAMKNSHHLEVLVEER